MRWNQITAAALMISLAATPVFAQGTNTNPAPPVNNPSTNPNINPNTNPNTNPSTNPNTNPSTNPGNNGNGGTVAPGLTPPPNPNTNPNTNPTTNPGTNPTTNPGTTTPGSGWSNPIIQEIPGEWDLNGQHVSKGLFTGTVTFTATQTANTFEYSRVTQFKNNTGKETENGIATLIGETLLLIGQRVSSNGAAGALSNAMGNGQTLESRANLSRVAGVLVFRGNFQELNNPAENGWMRIERHKTANTHLELLIDGSAAFPAFKATINDAQESVHIETYKWENDQTGLDMANLCAQKAQSGIEVRVLMDAIGSKSSQPLVDIMRAAGVTVIVSNPIINEAVPNLLKSLGNWLLRGVMRIFGFKRQPKAAEKRGPINRDHSKVMVIDGQTAYTGSMNIATVHEKKYHDVHARATGQIVQDLQRHFLDRWEAAGGTLPADLNKYFPPAAQSQGNLDADLIRHIPGLGNEVREAYLTQMKNATTKFYVENPYVLDDDIIDGLKEAAQRGVDVKVIIPNDKDHAVKLVREAFKWVRNDVMRAGVEIYKYKGRMVHSKVATCDGQWSTLGSSNLDAMSTIRNIELNVQVRDSAFAQEMEDKVFTPDLANSERAQEKKLKWWEKVTAGVTNFFRKFL